MLEKYAQSEVNIGKYLKDTLINRLIFCLGYFLLYFGVFLLVNKEMLILFAIFASIATLLFTSINLRRIDQALQDELNKNNYDIYTLSGANLILITANNIAMLIFLAALMITNSLIVTMMAFVFIASGIIFIIFYARSHKKINKNTWFSNTYILHHFIQYFILMVPPIFIILSR